MLLEKCNGVDPCCRSFTIKRTQKKTFICSFHSTLSFSRHAVFSLCHRGGVLRPDGAPSHEDVSVEKRTEKKQILNEMRQTGRKLNQNSMRKNTEIETEIESK